MSSNSSAPVRRFLSAAAAAAAVAGLAGCGAVPAQQPLRAAPAPPSAGSYLPVQPPPPQGVPAAAWAALGEFAQARAGTGRPLPEPAGGPVCTLPGPGCYFPYGPETFLWSPDTGIHAVRNEVFERWKSSVWTLGWPVASEYGYGAARRADFQHGTLMFSPRLGRIMSYEPAVEDMAVVIGDSQAGRDTWVGKGLASLGYTPLVLGAWGTGYTRGNGTVGNYPDALEAEQWLLPWGKPGLLVVQGGGNDAYGPDNAEIRRNAVRLIGELKRTYPQTRIVLVGVIGDGKGRRAEIDDLLARIAAEQGLDFLSPKDWWQRHGLGSKLEDGVHFGETGHDAAAPVFARELNSVLGRGENGPG